MSDPHRAPIVERAPQTRRVAFLPIASGPRIRVGAFAVAILLGIVVHAAAADAPSRRIYFLESLRPTQPAAIRTIDAFQKRLAEITTEHFEIFIDYLDLGRFPSQAHTDRSLQFLAGKYAEAPPDVPITLGRGAIPLMVKYRDAIAPRVPMIIASVTSRDAAEAKALTDTVFVTTEYDFAKTLQLASRLQVSVKDRGTGVKFEEQGQVFQPFYTAKDHGLGLGLAICSAIVDTHGGTLTLTNDKGGGACATFSMPAHEMLMAAQ